MSDKEENRRPERTISTVELSRWPGWIWAIPIAALLIAAWLLFRHLTYSGVYITIRFDRAAGMKSQETAVRYRGLKVGDVVSVTLSKDGRHVVAKVKMDSDVRKYLRGNTQFWLQGASPSLSNPSSLKAILAGPTIIMEPGGGKSERHFIGLDRRPAIPQPHGRMVRYVMSFDGPVGQLEIGAPVTLRGFTVGEVEEVGFRYDSATGAIRTPVIIALDPSRFHIKRAKPSGSKKQPLLNVVLRHLIKEGLRGRLAQNPPVVGSFAVALDFIHGASDASLETSGRLPAIPTVSGGGIGSIVRRVNRVPIDKIAEHVLQLTNRANSLISSSSPKLQASLKHLNQTLTELDSAVHRTAPQVSKLVRSLRQTSEQLNSAVLATQGVLDGSPTNQDRNVPTTLYEVTQAARSLRALANYLDRHPEALLKGRTR